MTDVIVPHRRCTHCGGYFPLTSEYFYRRKNGFQSWCKKCIKERDHNDRINNPEKAQARDRHYHKKYKERRNADSRRWRLENPEKARLGKQRWQANQPEKVRAATRRRRSKCANVLCTFTEEHERIALEYFNGCCAVCGRQLRDLFGTHTVHFDHWKPINQGGHTIPQNMIPLCGGSNGCNNSKHDRLPDEWLVSRFGKRKAKRISERINGYIAYINNLP